MKTTLPLSICLMLAIGAQARAQQAAPPTPQAAVKYGFEEVSGWLATAAAQVPADKYSYKPVAAVRSFGELMAHAADGMNWFCGSAKAGKDVPWSDAVEKGKIDKATVVAALKSATAGCAAAHAARAARFDRLMANVAHSNLHYGNAITYLRMLGLKPPSS
jgi:cytochrome c1